MRSEIITWHPASEPPDHCRTVLLRLPLGLRLAEYCNGSWSSYGEKILGFVQPIEWAELPQLKMPEPEWITPTDEHARSRPACEVSDDGVKWHPRKLVAVLTRSSYQFLATDGGEMFCGWKHCRIRKPAPAPEPQEVWIAPSHDLYMGIAYKSKQQAEVCSLPGTKLLRATIHGEATE